MNKWSIVSLMILTTMLGISMKANLSNPGVWLILFVLAVGLGTSLHLTTKE